jgi:hypothetical protein
VGLLGVIARLNDLRPAADKPLDRPEGSSRAATEERSTARIAPADGRGGGGGAPPPPPLPPPPMLGCAAPRVKFRGGATGPPPPPPPPPPMIGLRPPRGGGGGALWAAVGEMAVS